MTNDLKLTVWFFAFFLSILSNIVMMIIILYLTTDILDEFTVSLSETLSTDIFSEL